MVWPTTADVVASIIGRCCGGRVGIKEIHSIAHGAVLEWQFKLNEREARRTAMSKAQKGNKEEKKKRKADKNQPKIHVSAYKAAQGEAKPSFNPFARKT